MKGLPISLTLAAMLALAGCTSLEEAAKEECRAAYPQAGAAYQSCWQREYQRRLQEQSADLDRIMRSNYGHIGR